MYLRVLSDCLLESFISPWSSTLTLFKSWEAFNQLLVNRSKWKTTTNWCHNRIRRSNVPPVSSNSSFCPATPSQSSSLIYIRKCNFLACSFLLSLHTGACLPHEILSPFLISEETLLLTLSILLYLQFSAGPHPLQLWHLLFPSSCWLSRSLMNGCTLLPYGCLQLSMVGTASVFANVAANSSMAKLSRYLLVLISIPLSDTFQPLQNCLQSLILSTIVSLTLSSLFLSLQISAFV